VRRHSIEDFATPFETGPETRAHSGPPFATHTRVATQDEEWLEAQTRRVMSIARETFVGLRTVRVLAPTWDIAQQVVLRLAPLLRELGYLTVWPSMRMSSAAAAMWPHQHVAMIALTDEDRDRVAEWAPKLSRASPRGHLIVDCRVNGDGDDPDEKWLRSYAHAPPQECSAEAGTLMLRGELARAEAMLEGVVSACAAVGADVPVAVQCRRVELWFWQGRFEECASAAAGLRNRSAEAGLWYSLAEWATGAGTVDAARCALRDLCRISDRSSTYRQLARALRVEQALAAGRRTLAARLSQRKASSHEPRLYRALFDQLCAPSATRGSPHAARLEAFVRETGARGLGRWGMGRTGMHLLHALPALLRIAQEAEDDSSVLAQSCDWLKQHTGASGVAIVTIDGVVLAASDAQARRDLSAVVLEAARRRGGAGWVLAHEACATIAVPVRFAGSTLGFLLARGPGARAATVLEAGEATAPVVASAVRSRLDVRALQAAGESLAPEIIGHSPGMVAVRHAIARAAMTMFPVLVEGESGTGKELVARALHRLGPRRDRRMCAVNCAAFTDELVEAELFGYARGAFTGALAPRAGLFEEANSSTLFLDEVGELSPRAQAKLLRVLQEREIRRLGENATRSVDVRVVSATNRRLAAEASRGAFREDLLFRLAVIRVWLPPLRDRREDLPLLAQAFWRRLVEQGATRAVLSPDALTALGRHSWPGNIRELQNTMCALVVGASSRGRVTARHVEKVIGAGVSDFADEQPILSLDEARLAWERRTISAALARHSGSRSATARELGLSRQGLGKALRRLGLNRTGPSHETTETTELRRVYRDRRPREAAAATGS
jgi:DNA-binding NtrC family response regulator